jgi:16S rRNA (uracil1498-N3)-methyltransferase
MQLYFHQDIALHTAIQMDEEESGHMVRVLRKKEGEEIHITDGKGSLFLAQISAASPKRVQLQVLSLLKQEAATNHPIHIAIALTKNADRFEYFLEKAVELGVDRITPLYCKRGERNKMNMERGEKIIKAAMKQSERLFLPQFDAVSSFADFIKNDHATLPNTIKMIGACFGEKKAISESYKAGNAALIMIGPEGDFTEEEMQLAISAGYAPISLAAHRLRVESAGIAAVYALHLMNQ